MLCRSRFLWCACQLFWSSSFSAPTFNSFNGNSSSVILIVLDCPRMACRMTCWETSLALGFHLKTTTGCILTTRMWDNYNYSGWPHYSGMTTCDPGGLIKRWRNAMRTSWPNDADWGCVDGFRENATTGKAPPGINITDHNTTVHTWRSQSW